MSFLQNVRVYDDYTAGFVSRTFLSLLASRCSLTVCLQLYILLKIENINSRSVLCSPIRLLGHLVKIVLLFTLQLDERGVNG